MKDEKMMGADAFDARFVASVRAALDPGEIPVSVQERLERTYACLGRIPQERPEAPRSRRVSRGALAVAVAAACAMFAGAAYAAGNLIQMQAGGGTFFAGDKNLPIYDSMEEGARALSAEVGQSAVADGVTVTLDEISCDRSVANLYFTLTKEGDFDLDSLGSYEGSEEGEWSRLQNAIPVMGYALASEDGTSQRGMVRRLDAYLEDGAVKCLVRIVPEATMGDEVQLDISLLTEESADPVPAFSVGLDLVNVPMPRELAAQEISFDTAHGVKVLSLERFTVSELACVMVTAAPVEEGANEGVLDPAYVKVTDEGGAVLTPVDAGDGLGMSDEDARVIEFAGLSPEAVSVTFTPILFDEAAAEADRLARAAAYAAGEETEDDAVVVDVSAPGARIPLTELGGYEVSGWDVQGSTVTIRLAPYGWIAPGSAPELIAEEEPSMLASEWTDPETGEVRTGLHSAIRYQKSDLATGELVQIDSYYKAGEDELKALTSYRAHVYPAGWFTEDAQAAQSLAFS